MPALFSNECVFVSSASNKVVVVRVWLTRLCTRLTALSTTSRAKFEATFACSVCERVYATPPVTVETIVYPVP